MKKTELKKVSKQQHEDQARNQKKTKKDGWGDKNGRLALLYQDTLMLAAPCHGRLALVYLDTPMIKCKDASLISLCWRTHKAWKRLKSIYEGHKKNKNKNFFYQPLEYFIPLFLCSLLLCHLNFSSLHFCHLNFCNLLSL